MPLGYGVGSGCRACLRALSGSGVRGQCAPSRSGRQEVKPGKSFRCVGVQVMNAVKEGVSEGVIGGGRCGWWRGWSGGGGGCGGCGGRCARPGSEGVAGIARRCRDRGALLGAAGVGGGRRGWTVPDGRARSVWSAPGVRGGPDQSASRLDRSRRQRVPGLEGAAGAGPRQGPERVGSGPRQGSAVVQAGARQGWTVPGGGGCRAGASRRQCAPGSRPRSPPSSSPRSGSSR